MSMVRHEVAEAVPEHACTADAGARDAAPLALTVKQKIALAAGSSVPASAILVVDDHKLDYDYFVNNGITSTALASAGLSPGMLLVRGVTTAQRLRALGFDALDLATPAFCAQAVAAYGARDVAAQFIVTANDAVAVAGSLAVSLLGLDLGTLLVMCAGSPSDAYAVLEQSKPRGQVLHGVAAETLLDTGLRSQALTSLGYTALSVAAQTRATPAELEYLGF